MAINALNDKELPVYGAGDNVRDWIHVEDHCEAIDTILRRGRAGEVYNVGGGNEWANIDVVKAILKETGKGESLIRHISDRPGHDKRYAIDAGKLRRETGWAPRTPFEEGIKAAVKWYVANEPWWREILDGDYAEYYERMYSGRAPK
jgi:dTDP-glucose 4,6-dehydratase